MLQRITLKNNIYLVCIFGLLILSATACAQPGSISNPTGTIKLPASPTATNTHVPTTTPTIAPATTAQDAASDGELLMISSAVDMINRVMAVDPGNSDRLAYCGGEGILVSDDGGDSWIAISTEGVSEAAKEVGYEIFNNDPAVSNTCMYLVLDPAHPNSYYAVFTLAHEEYGAPPIFYTGFYTTDSGVSWQPIPPPDDADFESFGGLWVSGEDRVEALFTPVNLPGESQDLVSVQVTEDGGETWNHGSLSCPSAGPCLRWGAAASSIPGMGSPLPQDLLYSADKGESWETIMPAAELRTDPPNQIAATSSDEAQIIMGSIFLSMIDGKPQPLRITVDGGQNWTAMELPRIPAPDVEIQYFPGLQILPDGSYLTQSPEGDGWFWLQKTADSWCKVESESLPKFPKLLQHANGRLWWVDWENGRAESVAFVDISCAED